MLLFLNINKIEVINIHNRDILIFLHGLPGVGWKTIEKVIISFNSLNEIRTMNSLELSMNTGIEYKLAERIVTELKSEDSINGYYNSIDDWNDKKISVITYYDSDYPNQLKEIAQPPWVLYALGDIRAFDLPAIAVVGTRNPTNYGKNVTESIVRELTDYNLTIVSGMARGIDSIAHIGALSNGGTTIAVLGCGVDVIYPRENKKLYNEIIEKGLIISEYLPGESPIPGYFPQRNRIISGLSYGTLVVEASLSSGSLITAQFSLDQSREVFAIPGPITSKNSIGTNSLIKQGAKLVQTIEDIIEEFSYLGLSKKENNNKDIIEFSDNEEIIYLSLTDEPIHIDEIYKKSNIHLSEVYECLLSLQIKGLIRQNPGSTYSRKININENI